MVRITNKPRYPSLMRKFSEPWFDLPYFPFERTTHPWFRMTPWELMERSWDDYLDYMDRTFSRMPEFPSKFTHDISCDLADKGDKFVITADLPGMEKDEVDINITDGEIEISAEHKESKEKKEKGYIRKERSQVKYYRVLSIPEEIVSSTVTAKMTNGILSVDLPKKNPTKVEAPISVKVT